MTPKVPAGADLKRSETGVSEKNLRCISGTSAFRISRYQHYWRRKTTFLSLLRTFLVVERNPLLKNCGFYPLGTPVSLCLLARRKSENGDRSEIRVRQSGYSSVSFSAFPQFTDSVLLHRSATSNRRDITVSRNSLARCNARHLRIKHSVPFISVGPVYHNALTCCAALSSPRGPSLALRAIHLVPHPAERKPPV